MAVNRAANAPSAFWRGVVALAILVGFYTTTVALAIVLLGAPVAAIHYDWTHHARMFTGYRVGLLLAVTWGPAAALIHAIFVHRPKTEPGGVPLTRDEAPAVFAFIDELAARAGTRPPDEVWVTPATNFGLSEMGGFLGFGSRRALGIGVSLLTMLELGELRAMLAHALGRVFLGGESRLAGVTAYAQGLFNALHWGTAVRPSRSAAARAATSAVRIVVGWSYVRFYGAIMHRSGRRLVLAADALSVRLAGRAASSRALQKAHLARPLFNGYIGAVLRLGDHCQVVPTDLVAGYDRIYAILDASGTAAEVLDQLNAEKKDPLDTHPTLAERLAFVAECAEGVAEATEDRRPATTLFSDAAVLERSMQDALTETLTERLVEPKAMARIPWANFHDQVAPALQRRGAEWLTKFSVDPTMAGTFAFVVGELDRGNGTPLVHHAFPKTRRLGPIRFKKVAPIRMTELVGDLFAAALLERGGRVQPLLEERTAIVIELGGERVSPFIVAGMADDASLADMVVLRHWAGRFTAPKGV